MALLKQRPKLIFLITWLAAWSVAIAINGPGEVRSKPALIVLGSSLALLTILSGLTQMSLRFRSFVITSDEEYCRQRIRILAVTVASVVVATVCFLNAAR